MNDKKRTYYIASTNCDCSSDIVVRTNDPRKNCFGPRCPNCHKILGIMQWAFIKTISAISEWDAYEKYYSAKDK